MTGGQVGDIAGHHSRIAVCPSAIIDFAGLGSCFSRLLHRPSSPTAANLHVQVGARAAGCTALIHDGATL